MKKLFPSFMFLAAMLYASLLLSCAPDIEMPPPPLTPDELSSSSSSVGSSDLCVGFVNGTTREHYGKSKAQFCDSRDGKKYVYVSIGEQVWMAENMNYEASGSNML